MAPTIWSNWAGNVRAEAQRIARPASVRELQEEVCAAAARGWSIRVAGAGHSFAPICQTDGLLLDLSGMTGIEQIDPATGDATIMAGTPLHALGEPLLAAGRALVNQGDIDRQALAGAVSTGTHGTGSQFPSFSGMVQAIEVMTADGRLQWIEPGDGDSFRAAALAVGMLGVLTRIRLATVPAYRLREQTRAASFAESVRAYPTIESDHRNAEFWWVPPLDTCVIKTFSLTTDEPFTTPEVEHPPGTLERYLKGDKVDWSYRVYPSSRSLPFVECEYTLPLANGPSALGQIRDLIQSSHPEVRWGVEYRTMAGEQHLLSPTIGAPSVTISVHQAADQPWDNFMRASETIFLGHGGRPHWGKLHWLDRAQVDRLYPGAATFRSVRAAMDPDGVFLNDHLRPLFS